MWRNEGEKKLAFLRMAVCSKGERQSISKFDGFNLLGWPHDTWQRGCNVCP